MNTYRAAWYLQIPADYCRSFGGLRWAQYGEAVEFLDGPDAGRTFAFAAEIARFLEGSLATRQSFLAFGSVLHVLYLIGLGDRAKGRGAVRCLQRIALPFRVLGGPLRNAGALCGSLCWQLPGAVESPDLDEVLGLLGSGNWIPQMVMSHPALGVMSLGEQPAVAPEEFEEALSRQVDTLSDETIRHWLKHGRGPLVAPDARLALPRACVLAGVSAELARRPRLAGATRLVSRLEGAICLPPRRLARTDLENGGYSDVTTRGAPEQILPIQFALDEPEFLRRFAEHELLYFHREVPCSPSAEELVLLLDQGVRTWGDVRLALVGSALALARQAQRRKMIVRLATTGNLGRPVEIADLDTDTLAALLEASDLSRHPAPVLAQLLGALPAGRRDVVVLTHPRSLGEPEVSAAARLPASDAGTRLFAVSVDSAGRLELAALRRGLPVVLSRSRIDFQDRSTAESAAPVPATPTGRQPWRGPVEAIPFPFRCGVLDRGQSPPRHDGRQVDFDESGERLVVVGRHGLPFAWRIDGTECETLPRPWADGDVLKSLRTVIGVAGGFVLAGYSRQTPALCHYDFGTRVCTIHPLERAESVVSWCYYPDLHAIAACPGTDRGAVVAVDLQAAGGAGFLTPRARRAAERAESVNAPFPAVVSWPSAIPREHWVGAVRGVLRLDARTGMLEYGLNPSEHRSLVPMSDGNPALRGGRIVCVRKGGDVLAVLVEGTESPGIVFVSASRACVLGNFFVGDSLAASSLAVSRDGRRFSWRVDDRRVEVRDVPGDRPPVVITPAEEVWIHFASLGRSCLLVREFDLNGPRRPHSFCLIRWDQGRLEVVHRDAVALFCRLGGVVAESRSLPAGRADLGWDPLRFVQMAEDRGLRVLIDRYNHLAVLDGRGQLICMFYLSREEVAAWMPDGTSMGSCRLIDGERMPGAAERIAAALRAAEQRQRTEP
jgi:hypothetical protein